MSGSGSDNVTISEEGNAAVSSSPEREREREPSDAAIDIWSSGGEPEETGGVPDFAEVPARSNGTTAGCGVLEGWGTPLGQALTVILKSPLLFFYSTGRSAAPGAGSNARSRQRQRDPVKFDIAVYIMQLWDGPHKKNMNHPRKLPQRAECPGTWGSNRDRPEAPDNDHIQKCKCEKT